MKAVQEKVDVVSLGIGINGMRQTKNNKVIINCETESDRARLSAAIKEKTSGITVTVPNVRNPCLRLLGVINEYANDRVAEAISKQNSRILEGVSEDNRHIKYIRCVKGRSDYTKNVIIEVSPQIWNVLKDRKVKIGYQNIPAVDQTPIQQCYRCQGFGHRATGCTVANRCGHCAENHDTRCCPRDSEGQRCVNCRELGKPHDHPAYSQSCPEWQKWDRIARAAIRYTATYEMINNVKEKKYDVIFMTEPYVGRDKKKYTCDMDGYDVYQCTDLNAISKSCIAVRRKLGKYIGLTQHITSNFVAVELTRNNRKMCLSSIYVEPGEDPSRTMLHLEQFLQLYGNKEHIVCGDLNGWHPLWGSTRDNERGRAIYDLTVNYDLIVCNKGNEATFETITHTQKRQAIIDITIATIGMANNIVNWRVNREVIPTSDHHGIEFAIKTSQEFNKKIKSTSTYKYNTGGRIDWEEFRTKLKENTERSNINDIDIDQLDTAQIDTYINNMTNIITKTCDVQLTRKEPYFKIPWWTQELTDMKKKVIFLHHRLQDLKRGKKDITNILNEVQEARKEYVTKIRTTSSNHFRDFCSKQGKDDVWSVTNRLLKNSIKLQPPSTLKSEDGRYTLSTQDTAEKLAAKFFPDDTSADDTAHHLEIRAITRNNNNNRQLQPENIPNIDNNEPPFTTNEITEIMKYMSPRKAPGIDHLTADICQ
ncbi:uncharacterized protein LOC134656635 [Cydia amplana]|uniref:uncharacterized protein LOC134656635 n=1 Tax=Cydia amplana TaxID=1869771 RepID=UPI002FE548BE